jgi:hypothetical protein
LAAFVLGRNVSRDGTLISGLVQVAIERIVLGYLVQQWPDFSTEAIGAFFAEIDNAPPRGTMAESMETERLALYGWLLRQIQQLQEKYSGNEPKALEEATKTFGWHRVRRRQEALRVRCCGET